MSWAIGMALIGLFLFVIEVFVPSHGALTVAAFGALTVGVVKAYGASAVFGNGYLVGLSLLLPVLVYVSLRIFPRTWAGKRLISPGLSFPALPATDPRDLGLVGQLGTVVTPLRPAGHALIAGRRVDVVTRGEALDIGSPVRVLEVSGNRVLVALDSQGHNATAATANASIAGSDEEPAFLPTSGADG
jgi:membrane-bound serine protease (ClpP class)